MDTLAFLTQLLLLGLGIFLMIVILLQRGRGGGLAGAFGGLGGQSAFGTKAGDVFTKITVVIAVAWVVVAGGSGYFLRAVDKGTRAEELGEVSTGMSAADEDDADFDAGVGFEPDAGSSDTAAPGSGTDTPAAGDDAQAAPQADSKPAAEPGEPATKTPDSGADAPAADGNSASESSESSDADAGEKAPAPANPDE